MSPSRRQSYWREIFETPLLSREEERALFFRYQKNGDRQAFDAIVGAHMKLVFMLVRRYCKPHDQRFEDLMQEGSLGLIEAAGYFKLARELRFSTYATHWVVSRVRGRLLKDAHLVRVITSTQRKKAHYGLQREKRARGILARPVSGSEAQDIAKKFGTSEDVIAALDSFADGFLSLDMRPHSPSGDSSLTIGDLLPSGTPNPEETAERKNLEERKRTLFKKAFAKARASIPPRNMDIFSRHYVNGETLGAIADDFCLSCERVRQISVRVLCRVVRAMQPLSIGTEFRPEIADLARLSPDVLGRKIKRRMTERRPAS
ncbi:MAG: sigma-70 family RNA polymerase sigma factor [Parcubacteria group bacterium]|nr:sigma-70 family RNA polymerase sigma factor [Parcubacteria group bacterium]